MRHRRNKNGCTFFLLSVSDANSFQIDCIANVDSLVNKVRTVLSPSELEDAGEMKDLAKWALNAKPGAPFAYYSAIWIIAFDPTQDNLAIAEYSDKPNRIR